MVAKHRQLRPIRMAPILVLTTTVGCSSGADRTSAVETWSVDASPSVVIGGEDDRPDYIVFGVVAATRLTDDRIVVAAQRSTEVKYFDAQGNHIVTSGRAGDGPGEFRAIIHASRLAGDSLLVLSRSPGLTWLSPEGEFVRAERFDGRNGDHPCRIAEFDRHTLGDGSVVSVFGDNLGNPGCPPIPPSPWRETALLLRHDIENASVDTLAIMPGVERNTPNYRVFGKALAFAFGSDRLYVSDTGSDTILALDMSGDTLNVLPSPFPEVSVSAPSRTADVRRFTLPGGQEQVGNPYLYPDVFPRMGRMLVDRSGFLWVMAYPQSDQPLGSTQVSTIYGFVVEEGGARWSVLDPDTGELIAHVRTPPNLFPLEIGDDYILGVSKDEFDVEAVQLHRLSRMRTSG